MWSSWNKLDSWLLLFFFYVLLDSSYILNKAKRGKIKDNEGKILIIDSGLLGY